MQRFWLVFTFAVAALLGLLAIVAPVSDWRFWRGPSAFTRHCYSGAAADIGDRGNERFIHDTQSLATRIHHL